ncbi:hypothetical protein O9993_11930 [Vibrio lentus]|nr:hypothetical protein [Vibrio lentus]
MWYQQRSVLESTLQKIYPELRNGHGRSRLVSQKQVTQESHNFVYGHYAVDNGKYIILTSPTSAGNYEWFATDYLN